MAIVINGSGTVTGISVGGLPDDIVDAGTLADNAVGLAQMAGGTDGNIITYDTSGNPAVVATGSDGQILTSAGANAVPAFETAAAGGKVLQVVHSSTDFDTSSASDVELYTASITPSATSSKVLILFSCAMQIDNGEYAKLSIYRGSLASGSAVFTLDDVGFLQSEPGGMHRSQSTGHFLDSPSTTSSQQYSIVGVNIGGVTMRYGAGANNPITLMEIGA